MLRAKKILSLAIFPAIVVLLLSVSCASSAQPTNTASSPLADVERRIGALEQNVASLNSKPAGVTVSDIIVIQNDIVALQGSIIGVKGSITTLDAKVGALVISPSSDAAIATINVRLALLEEGVAALASKASVSAVQASLSGLAADIDSMVLELDSLHNLVNGQREIIALLGGGVAVTGVTNSSTDCSIAIKVSDAGNYPLLLNIYGNGHPVSPMASSGTVLFANALEDSNKAMINYTSGRASFANGDIEVAGNVSGTYRTYWTSAMVGGTIRRNVSNVAYTIVAVDVGNQVITLDEPYDGASAGSVPYVLSYLVNTGNVNYQVVIFPPAGGWVFNQTVNITVYNLTAMAADVQKVAG